MAKVMIGEPSADVRELLVHTVVRLGHEACVAEPESGLGPIPDLLVFEPAEALYLELAATLRRRAPGLPLVVCSIEPPRDETRALAPLRHVMKPFLRAELADAIGQAARAAGRG